MELTRTSWLQRGSLVRNPPVDPEILGPQEDQSSPASSAANLHGRVARQVHDVARLISPEHQRRAFNLRDEDGRNL